MEVNRTFQEIKTTANEFNCRGDLFAGANIANLLRIANQCSINAQSWGGIKL